MESIACLLKELPSDYEQDCLKSEAIKRFRGVSSPADLMMLALFHLHNGCSLMEISEIAKITKLGQMSDVAFMKRFEKCLPWFEKINIKLRNDSIIEYSKPSWLNDKSVIAVDATDIVEKSRSKRIFRLHFSLDLFKMCGTEHKITTNKTGENLTNFNFKPSQIIIADRAYSTIKGIEHCIQSGAEFILRLKKNSFSTQDLDGEKIQLSDSLNSLSDDEILDINVIATNVKKEKIPVRICAIRKNADAITKSHKRLKRQYPKQQRKLPENTQTFNEYIVIVTNLSSEIPAHEILELYRLRWQIELYFKRLKSIMQFGELPKRREKSILAWLNGKIMVALLLEKISAKISFFPTEINKP